MTVKDAGNLAAKHNFGDDPDESGAGIELEDAEPPMVGAASVFGDQGEGVRCGVRRVGLKEVEKNASSKPDLEGEFPEKKLADGDGGVDLLEVVIL